MLSVLVLNLYIPRSKLPNTDIFDRGIQRFILESPGAALEINMFRTRFIVFLCINMKSERCVYPRFVLPGYLNYLIGTPENIFFRRSVVFYIPLKNTDE